MTVGAVVLDAYLPGMAFEWPLIAKIPVMCVAVALFVLGLFFAFQLKLRLPKSKALCTAMIAVPVLSVALMIGVRVFHISSLSALVLLLMLMVLPVLIALFGIKLWQANR